jgi:hypothetical protein
VSGPLTLPPATAPAADENHRGLVEVLRVAAILVGALVALGAALGLIWAAWSPAGPRAFVYAPGRQFAYEESEAWVGADGRFLVLTAVAGLAVGFAAWLRTRNRGPAVTLALAVGGLGGALVTEWIGYLTGGGSDSASVGTIIRHLPLSLHTHGFWFVEPALGVLIYAMFAAFTAHDDLGRPDPVRAGLVSVRPDGDPQHARGHRDAARVLQQHELPPQ